jgi:hypothetical protein
VRCNGAMFVLLALLVTALSTCSERASAHGVDPIGVVISERDAGEVSVRIGRPASLAGVEIAVVIEAECTADGARERSVATTRAVDELRYRCARPLAGRSLYIEGLDVAGLDAVVRAELADGTVHRSVLTAAAPAVSLPAEASRSVTLLAYIALGAKHLLVGFDHLLFILGTLLLERRLRRTALALTGFTVGHSLTLCAAALGLLRVPSAWAEVGIALSLVWLAVAITRRGDAPCGRGTAGVSMAIGLVHGLGFAGVLVEAGVPRAELPLALFGFNLGIELSQLGLVALALGIVALAKRVRLLPPAAARAWLAHGIGALAVMWCIERVLAG